MLCLSDLIKDETLWFHNYGLVILGALAENYLKYTKEVTDLLEGLCPERVYINDEWLNGNIKAMVKPANGSHTSYAYYPPEYLKGQKWDATCSVFAVFAIAYKVLTGELPFIGNVPEELLASEEGIKYIEKKRNEGILNVQNIPTVFRYFMIKGLMLKKEERYNTIGDTADDYSELSDRFHDEYGKDDTLDVDDESDFLQPDFEKMFAQRLPDFVLNVQKAESGSLDNLVG